MTSDAKQRLFAKTSAFIEATGPAGLEFSDDGIGLRIPRNLAAALITEAVAGLEVMCFGTMAIRISMFFPEREEEGPAMIDRATVRAGIEPLAPALMDAVYAIATKLTALAEHIPDDAKPSYLIARASYPPEECSPLHRH